MRTVEHEREKPLPAKHEGQTDAFRNGTDYTESSTFAWPNNTCGHCGAVNTPAGIGLEPTLAEHIANIVDVFRELRRVLRDDGTAWLNYGDAMVSGKGVPSYGTTDKESRGSKRHDSSLNGLCGECQDSSRVHTPHTASRHAPESPAYADAPNQGHMDLHCSCPDSSDCSHQTKRPQSFDATVDQTLELALGDSPPRVSQESTTLESSHGHTVEYSRAVG